MVEQAGLIMAGALGLAGAIAVVVLFYAGITGSIGFTVSWYHYFGIVQRIELVMSGIVIIMVGIIIVYFIVR
ncbi:hypothetical protein IX51_11035 [uncultured archaeon]|nr:hypothetical protein IX51_11035 [uncultured archaeon]